MLQYLTYTIAFIMLYVTVVWLNFLYNMEKDSKKRTTKFPMVTIAIPAHNEANVIEETLNKILEIDYPHLDIIVVDDASTDKTNSIVKRFARKYSHIRLITRKQSQGCKAPVTNCALKAAKGEIFAVLDADCYFDTKAIKSIIHHFDKTRVAAVVPATLVAQTDGVYEKVQRIEYIFTSLIRKLMSSIDTLFLTNGGTVFRTSTLRELGGFDEDNITEDLEIALRMRSHGYTVKCELDSRMYTYVPTNFKEVWDQRIRWFRGFIYNTRKYSSMILRRKHGLFGCFQIPLNIMLPFFLLVTSGLFVYETISRTYTFIYRSLLIQDYFMTHVLSLTTPKDYLLGQNMKIFLPLILTMVLGIFLYHYSHRALEEKHQNPLAILSYYLIYPHVTTLHWIGAAVLEVFKVKKKW